MTLAVWQATIVNGSGDIQPSVEVTVLDETTGLFPASGIYADRAGAVPITEGNLFADTNGFVRFYANPGEYRVTVAAAAGQNTFRYQILAGTAALADLTTSATDTTAGRVTKVGDFGIGGSSTSKLGIDLNTILDGGNYYISGITNDAAVLLNYPELGTGTALVHWNVSVSGSPTRATQVATEVFGQVSEIKGRQFVRVKHDATWSEWEEKYNTKTLNQFVWGGNSLVGEQFGVGVAYSATGVWMQLDMVSAFDVSSVEILGSFDVVITNIFNYGTVTAANIAYSAVRSNGRTLCLDITGLTGLTSKDTVTLRTATTTAKITVTI